MLHKALAWALAPVSQGGRMKKPSIKKITLHRETLRDLQAGSLEKVVAGKLTDFVTCYITCLRTCQGCTV
jgi:hypothetical protein